MNMTRKRIISYFLILGLFFSLFIVIYKKYGFYYAINDDSTMQALASGSITGVPDGHLVFIMYPLGVMIATLFVLFPQYDWYGIVLIGFLFLSYSIIAYRLLFYKKIRSKITGFLITATGFVMLIALIIDSAVMFQFTVVAGVLATTAVFLIASSSDVTLKDMCFSWVLIILAAMVRMDVFYMILPVFLIICTSRIISKVLQSNMYSNNRSIIYLLKTYRAELMRGGLVLISGLLLIGLLKTINDLSYSYEPWKSYIDYTRSRSIIMDYYSWPPYEENKNFWNSLNISEDEYNCLPMYGILPDFNENVIEQIAELSESTYRNNYSFMDRISKAWNVLIKAAKFREKREWNILLLLAIIMALIIGVSSSKIVKLELLGTVLIVVAEILYLCYRGRLPERVIAIIDYECVLGVLGIIIRECRGKGSQIITKANTLFWAISFILSFIIICSMYKVKVDSIAAHNNRINIYQEEMLYLNQHPEFFFVNPTGGFVPEKRFTIHQLFNDANNSVGTLSWTVYSPWIDNCFIKNNIDRNSYYLLNENVYMFTDDLIWANILDEFYLSKGITDKSYEIKDTVIFSDGRPFYFVKWYPPVK